MLYRTIKKELNRILIWQLIFIMALAFIFLLIENMTAGAAVVAGGLSYWVPSLIFIKRITSTIGPRNAEKFFIALMAGEAIKLLLTAALFVLIVRYTTLDSMYMTFGLIAAILGYVMSSILVMLIKGRTI